MEALERGRTTARRGTMSRSVNLPEPGVLR
jgi:hypothetical protein